MKRIILHIGTEKTATTSLQAFFSLNQAKLSEQGIWYPTDESLDYCHRDAHFPLAASVVEEMPDFVSREKYLPAEPLFRKLLADFDARPEETLLLSAEHFSSRCSRPERNLLLAQMLAGRDVSVLVYLRPQHEMLVSSYSTLLKNGGKKTLDQVSREMWLRPKALYFNHSVMVERWLANFPLEKFTARVFQKQALVDGDIYADIMQYLDIKLDDPQYPGRLNTPISKECADFLYLANQHFPHWRDGDRTGWERGQKFRGQVIPMFASGTPIAHLLSPQLLADTKDYFAEYNRKLCDLVRPDLGGELFTDSAIDRELADVDLHENIFTDEFVSWVIKLWEAKLPLHRKLVDLVRP